MRQPQGGRPVPFEAALAPVLHFIGIILCCLAAVMLVPALVDLAYDHRNYRTFLAAAGITCFVGISLTCAFSGKITRIGRRDGVLAVILTWAGAVAFGALLGSTNDDGTASGGGMIGFFFEPKMTRSRLSLSSAAAPSCGLPGITDRE